MKTIKRGHSTFRIALLTCLMLLGVAQAPHARADMMLLSDTTMVTGSESAVFSFDAPAAGTVTAELTNLPWPERLSALSFAATTATDVVSSWSTLTSHVESFQVGAGTYFAHIMATTAGSLDLGLYSLSLTFTPTVPIPASAWLLAIGLFSLFAMARLLGTSRWFEVFRTIGPEGLNAR